MSKTIIILSIIFQTFLLSPCYSQSTNQFERVNCCKVLCEQVVFLDEVREGNSILRVNKPIHFPGGKDSLIAFINRNINWPITNYCGQATVYVEITLDSIGAIKDQKIVHGVCDIYDKEALRIISIMPNWIIPANQKRIETETKINVGIKFSRF